MEGDSKKLVILFELLYILNELSFLVFLMGWVEIPLTFFNMLIQDRMRDEYSIDEIPKYNCTISILVSLFK